MYLYVIRNARNHLYDPTQFIEQSVEAVIPVCGVDESNDGTMEEGTDFSFLHQLCCQRVTNDLVSDNMLKGSARIEDRRATSPADPLSRNGQQFFYRTFGQGIAAPLF